MGTEDQDQHGEPKKDLDKNVASLPTGISIGEVLFRYKGLIVIRFNFTELKTPATCKITDGAAASVELRSGADYEAELDQKTSNILLRPLATPEAKAVILPKELDNKLIFGSERKKRLGLEIELRAGDEDLEAVVSKLGGENYSRLHREISEGTQSLGEAQIDSIITRCIESSGLGGYERGKGIEEGNARTSILVNVDDLYIKKWREGELLSAAGAVKASAEAFFSRIKGIIDANVSYLKEKITDNNQFAFAMDFSGTSILTTYIPEKGWTVSLPIGGCPSASVRMMGRLMSEDKENYDWSEEAYREYQDLTEEGVLVVDKARKIVIFKDLKRLHPSDAVYNNDSVTSSLQTILGTGDPYLGELLFSMILFKEAKPYTEAAETVVIGEEDLPSKSGGFGDWE